LVREKGGDVESALLAIYNKLVELAMAGDVRAAQVLLDRLCGRMPLAEVDQVEGPMRVLVVRTGVPARRSSTDPPHLRA
jgi:hypothetical protein